jgi:hypothetical protein
VRVAPCFSKSAMFCRSFWFVAIWVFVLAKRFN